ncbi:MAG: NADPH:quinone reductase [Acidimicrobiales bacterium]|nr:MAG: NADPH:quinone reductase [Acidimicrobiales bacterium]
MFAVVVRKYGGPESLELVEVAIPEPGPGEVRIKVAAAAVNPVDIATRAGFFAGVIGERPTVGIGWDVAGTVDAVGSEVTTFAVADKVVALLDEIAVDLGTYAEYVVLAAGAVAHAPTLVDPVAASTLPLNALTAEQALDLLALTAGQALLITGAAGALGGYAVTLAHRRGLRVFATAAAHDEVAVREFGADVFVARTTDLSSAVRAVLPGGVDGVLDAARIGLAARDCVRDGGSFVAVNDPDMPPSVRGITVQTVHVHHDGNRLAELVQAVDAGTISPRVTKILPLAQASEAHRLVEKGGLRGRIVLVP